MSKAETIIPQSDAPKFISRLFGLALDSHYDEIRGVDKPDSMSKYTNSQEIGRLLKPETQEAMDVFYSCIPGMVKEEQNRKEAFKSVR